MKMIHTLAAVAVMLPLGLSAEESSGSPTFQQLDKDHDGYVSIVEATGQKELLKQWTSFDKDANGLMEQSEFSAFETENEPSMDAAIYGDDNEIGAGPAE